MRLVKTQIYNLFLLLFFVLSCTEKGKYDDYHLFIKNNSTHEINIITFNNNIETNNITLSNNQRDLECSFEESFFGGYNYSSCNIDSIKIVFPNGKGYLCGSINNNLCFGNEITPWSLNEKFINTNGYTYEFTITEEDYNNALDIPE